MDLTKSNNYQLLCEILGLCIEAGLGFDVDRFGKSLIIWKWEIDYGSAAFLKCNFTLDTPSPELEQAKQDLINYKYQTKQENNVRQKTTNRI